MVQRWAVATGNWSNTATWNGGTLPSSGDDVYANNFTVTIDQNVTAASLNIIAGTTAVVGGGFTSAMTGTIALTNLVVGSFTGTSTGLLRLTGGAVTLTVTNTVTSDTSTTGDEPMAILITGGTHTINANISASGVTSAVDISGGATVTINGNITGGSGASRFGVNISASTLTVVGNVAGGASSSGGYGIFVSGSSNVTVTGNITGVASNLGVFVSSGNLTVTGDISGASQPGVQVGGGCTLTARGNLHGGSANAGHGVVGSSASAYIRVSGDIYVESNGSIGIASRFMLIAGETLNWHMTDDSSFPSGWGSTPVVLTSDSFDPQRYLNVGGVATPIG